jgi:hypothetical protein
MASLHVVRRDLSPFERGMSRYAGADTLILATAGFLALTVALLAVRKCLEAAPRAASHSLVAASVGLLLVVATPIGNPTTSSAVEAAHTFGGLVFYVGVTSAMFMAAFDVMDRWIAGAMSVALALFILGAMGTPGLQPIVGLLQRAVFGIVVIWIARSGLRRRTSTPL